jgi:hypothetical protein
MGASDEKKAWDAYRERELRDAEPLLKKLGYTLDEKQVHTGGERYLMAGARDVGGGGRKLVLTGRRISDQSRVIIKVSSEPAGIREIERERASRVLLHSLNFATSTFSSPEELLFQKQDGRILFITSYIEEELTFIEHELEEQFFLALHAFETQESVHATTSAHAQTIEETFGIVGAKEYLELFETFRTNAISSDPENERMREVFNRTFAFLHEHRTVIERYSGFLTHSDFSPQNIRIRNRTLFLLDYASMYFGNKYESWARFINFMTQHNPALERMLVEYVRKNRGEEEHLSLRLMRMYKLGFLLQFWTAALAKSEGDLHALVRLRVSFWTEALDAVLRDTPISEDLLHSYLKKQATLRSDEEKARQREILAR